mmetsp:Transcript_54691/g.62854  ORF Transcript_54691/g.62854 Transcript_54691/m.62854 type:complete len:243 (+) Transcript_54691:51-779(+)
MSYKAIFVSAILLLAFLSSNAQSTQEDQLKLIQSDLANTSNATSVSGTSDYLKVLSALFEVDKCLEDVRSVLTGSLALRIARRERHSNWWDYAVDHILDLLFLDAKIQSLAAINQDCALVYSYANFLALELLQRAGVSNSTGYLRKRQIINTHFEDATLRSIVSTVENLNAFWSCTIQNIKFTVMANLMIKDGYFTAPHHNTLDVLDVLNSFLVRFNYNVDQCKVFMDVFAPAQKKFLTEAN